jgi:hypothetical protein
MILRTEYRSIIMALFNFVDINLKLRTFIDQRYLLTTWWWKEIF